MLAMKFLHYQQDHSSITAGEDEGGASNDKSLNNKNPPTSLFLLAAEMIKVGPAAGVASEIGFYTCWRFTGI